jgi:hypothetical protein
MSVEITIKIPEPVIMSAAGHRLAAAVEPAGYSVTAWCSGWGRDPDGTVRVDIRATVTSPAGLLPPYTIGGPP